MNDSLLSDGSVLRKLDTDSGQEITQTEHDKNYSPRLVREELPRSGIFRIACGGGYWLRRGRRRKD